MDEAQLSVLGVAIRDIGRLNQVLGIVVRHGFGELLLRSAAGRRLLELRATEVDADLLGVPAGVRVRRLLEALGPTWIKLGQILSMRVDIVPPDLALALQSLQDAAPTLTFDEVRGVVEAALGRPLLESFASFDEQPLATASIGQTHLATTRDGERVVVKVQRPGIERKIRGDLDLLFLAARLVEAAFEDAQLYAASDIVAEFERSLVRELNFTHELGNLLVARQHLRPEVPVHVPKPHPELSARTVLTMEFFPGKSLRTLAPRSPAASHAVELITRAACKQVFADGFFHGDPHPGNVLVDEAGNLCNIDWGLVGQLSLEQREDLVGLVLAAISADAGTMARLFLKMGTPTRRVNLAEFKSDILRIRRDHLAVGGLGQVDSQAFIQEFVGAANRFGIRLAPEYSVLVKAAATLEGVFRSLDPDVDVVAIARPYLEDLVRSRYAPKRLAEELLSEATGIGSLVRQLPGHVDQLFHDLESGNLQVRTRAPELAPLIPAIENLGSRVTMGLFSASLSVAAALLLPNDPFAVEIRGRMVPVFGLAVATLATLGWVILWTWYWVMRGQRMSWMEIYRLYRRS